MSHLFDAPNENRPYNIQGLQHQVSFLKQKLNKYLCG